MSTQIPAKDPVVRDTRTLQVVTALEDRGLLSPGRHDDALEVVDRVLGDQAVLAAPLRRRAAELAGYVGGAFVVAAAAIFFAVQFGTLSVTEQVLMLAGIAALLAAAGVGVAVSSGEGLRAVRAGLDPVRRRLAGVLFTGAAGSAAGAVGLLVDDYQTGTTAGVGAAFAAAATFGLLSLAGYLVAPTVVGQLGVAGSAAFGVPLLLDLVGNLTGPETALSVLAVGVLWLVATERGLWREVAAARVVGVTLAVLGAQLLVLDVGEQRWVGYLALALVASGAFATYAVRPAWPYLAAGVVALTLVVPEALLDWTDNELGPAGVMLATGLTLLGTSLFGLRLRHEAR